MCKYGIILSKSDGNGLQVSMKTKHTNNETKAARRNKNFQAAFAECLLVTCSYHAVYCTPLHKKREQSVFAVKVRQSPFLASITRIVVALLASYGDITTK